MRPMLVRVVVLLAGLAIQPARAQSPERPEVVTGTVLAAADGRPLAGAKVELGRFDRRTRRFISLRDAVTSAEGGFAFENLPLQAGAVRASAQGWATASDFLAAEIAFRLHPGRSVSGFVFDRATGDPIPGAEVSVTEVWSTTDAAGGFVFDGVRADAREVSVRAHAPGYVAVETTFVLAGNMPLSLQLEAGRVLSVQVLSQDGAPVAGARVWARLPRAVAYSPIERAVYEATTDALGIATVIGLPPGHPVVAGVRPEGGLVTHLPAIMPRDADEHAEDPMPMARVILGAERTGLVRVTDENDRPLEGAEIVLHPLMEPQLAFGGPPDIDRERGGDREGETGPEGEVRFAHLPNDWITCEVRAAGRVTQMITIAPGDPGPVAVCVALRPDPRPTVTDLPWSASVDAAWARADREGLPVLVSMTMDNEAANDFMAGHHWHDPEVIRVAREMPLLLSTVFQHGDGEVCDRYGHIPCSAHQAVEPYAVSEFIDSVDFQVPRQIFVTPDGDVLMHRTYYLSERELVRMMVRALRVVKPGVAIRLARERLARLAEGLGSADAAERGARVEVLVNLANSGDEHAIALLLDLVALGVPPATRLAIINFLIPEAVPFPAAAFSALVTDPDPVVRFAAVERLGRVADQTRVVELLASRFDDEHQMVAESVRRALRVVGDPETLEVAEAERGRRWEIVLAALRETPVEHIAGLRECLGQVSPEGSNRLLRAIASRGGDPSASRLLLSEVGRDGPRGIAALHATRLAAPALPRPALALRTLARHLNRPSSLARAAAVDAIAAFDADGVEDLLRSGLDDPSTEVALRAALGLWRRGDRSGIELMLSRLSDPLTGREIQAALAETWHASVPETSDEWRRWLESRGAIPKR